jgi:uncharacterized membrane protein
MRDYIDAWVVICAAIVVVVVCILFYAIGTSQGRQDTTTEWEKRIEDCMKIGGFSYNNQLYSCSPTKQWAPEDFTVFM